MSTKHTPGSWVCQATDRDGPDYGVAIIGALIGDDGQPLFTPTNGLVGMALPFPTEIDSRDYSRVEANARLIAAAPDLLEALEVIAGGDTDVSGTAIILGNGVQTVMRQVRAAIAKATGDQA